MPLKISEMLELIEADGWYLVCTRGSHRPEVIVSTYAVIIERADDGGYGAWCPDLPGCVALGDSKADALAEMKKAIEFHLEGVLADGLPIPHPNTVAATTVTTTAA